MKRSYVSLFILALIYFQGTSAFAFPESVLLDSSFLDALKKGHEYCREGKVSINRVSWRYSDREGISDYWFAVDCVIEDTTTPRGIVFVSVQEDDLLQVIYSHADSHVESSHDFKRISDGLGILLSSTALVPLVKEIKASLNLFFDEKLLAFGTRHKLKDGSYHLPLSVDGIRAGDLIWTSETVDFLTSSGKVVNACANQLLHQDPEHL